MILGNGQFHGGRLPQTIRSRIGPTSSRRSSMDFLIRKRLWIDISQGYKNHPLMGKERHAVHRYRFLSTLHGSGALKHPCSLTDQFPVLPESSGGVHDGFHLGRNSSISGRNPEHDPSKPSSSFTSAGVNSLTSSGFGGACICSSISEGRVSAHLRCSTSTPTDSIPFLMDHDSWLMWP